MRLLSCLVPCLAPCLVVAALAAQTAAAAGQTACTATVTPVSFGAYSPFLNTPLDSTGQVNVTCSEASGYSVAMNAGVNAGGNFANRRMSNGDTFLSYQLYTDSTRSTIWGDGSGGSMAVSQASPGISTVYARLPARQSVSAGTFTDTILVTITY